MFFIIYIQFSIFNRIVINGKIGDWGLGIGDWGLGIGPNPQSPIPNPHPQSPLVLYIYLKPNKS